MKSIKTGKFFFILIISFLIVLAMIGTYIFSVYKVNSKTNNSSMQIADPLFYIDKTKTTSNFRIVDENTDNGTGLVEGNINIYLKNYYNTNINETKGRAYIEFYTDGKYKINNFNFKFETIDFTSMTQGSTPISTPDITKFKFNNNGKSDWFDIIACSSNSSGEEIKIAVKVYCFIPNLADYKDSNNDLTENLFVRTRYEQIQPAKV